MKRLLIALLLSFIIYHLGSNFVFAQSQSPCSGSASITDTSQAQPGVALVVSNSAQAGFTITGPASYQGSGYAWAQQSISAGTYTITWSPVPGCGTTSPETKTTDTRGSIAFVGNYQNRFDLMMAASTVATIPVVVLFFLLQRHIVRSLTAGAVKG